MKKILIGLSLTLTIIMIFLSGCSENKETDNGKLKIAVTIEVQRGLVEALAGDLADITVLVPKGGSPETFEASPRDIERFRNADIYFAMDLPVENSKNLPSDGTFRKVDLGEASREKYEDLFFDEEERDHHTWLSPKRVMAMVERIAAVLMEEDPANKEAYRQNMEAFLARLEQLDKDIEAILAGKTQRTFLIYHPALGYFADDYGLEMLALEEEGKEADPGRIKEMVDLARSKGITSILTTEEISSKQVESFAEEIGGSFLVLEVLGKDYIGTMQNIAEIFGEIL